MILAIECIAACLIFGVCIVISVLLCKTAWLQDYAPAVQQKFLENNPDYREKREKRGSLPLIIGKLCVCALFTAILSALGYFAGARDFITGALYCYIIWAVVNIFDVIFLDLWLFAKWKRIRLPGTEDMDKEYASNGRKSILDGVWGMLIGLPVACVCGFMIHLLAQ